MKIYIYRCMDCGEVFEHIVESNLQTIEELGYDIKPQCVRCNSKNVKKVITPVGVIFKGEGFTKSAKKES